jgi:ABC-type lipoprotein export system ATPase subunit
MSHKAVPPTLNNAFSTKDLTKVYGSGSTAVHALRGVSIDIPEGEMVVLLGPSGSGKSTLLNILGGLDHATAGQAYFQDQQLSAFNDYQLTQYRREHIGFVFQFYNLMPSLTAKENIELVTEIATNPLDALAALDLVGFIKTSALGVEERRVNVIVKPDPAALSANNIGHGYRVEAAIILWESQNAILVPTSAMFRHNGNWAVFVVENDISQLVEITVERNNGFVANVLQGLNVGDRVVLYPSSSLNAGDTVAAR